jgi:hypothetical protein
MPTLVTEATTSHTRSGADEEEGGGSQLDGEAVVGGDGEVLVDGDEEGEIDTEFYDSDWDAEDGDDDIFESQVVKEFNDNNEPLAVHDLEDDAALGDEDFKLTIEEEYLK